MAAIASWAVGIPTPRSWPWRFYRHVVQADLDPVDCLTAELVKTMENAYRDVQISFANEMALLCEDMGADVWQVRELVNKRPTATCIFRGPG